MSEKQILVLYPDDRLVLIRQSDKLKRPKCTPIYNTESAIEAFRAAIDKVLARADNELIDKLSSTVPEWAWKDADGKPIKYTAGMVRSFSGDLYRCSQDHDSAENMSPMSAVYAWDKLLADALDEWPTWVQPQAHNLYQRGAKVTHKGDRWILEIDQSGWEPGTNGSGWTKQ